MSDEKNANDDGGFGLKAQLGEAMKKIVLTGVGTIFMTEETIRSYLGEIKLPKELWAGIIENASKTKNEFLNNFAKETAMILSHIDFSKEAQKFFEGHKMKINIEVSFDKKDGIDLKVGSETSKSA